MFYLIAQQGCHVQSTSSYFAISSYRAEGRYEHLGGGGIGFYADITKEWSAMVKNLNKLEIKPILIEFLGFCQVQRHLELFEEILLAIPQ